jgi:hypothetical protein
VELNPVEMLIATGDDGVHADSTLTLLGGIITISDSYEGLESANLDLQGGTVNILSSDDGINAAGGNDGSGTGRGGPGDWGGGMPGSGDYYCAISGGTYYINAEGDGLDINGSIDVSGGDIYVDGPTGNGNGALDCDGEFIVTDGTILAIGSSGMAETPDSNSTLYSFLVQLRSTYSAGKTVSLLDSDGNTVFSCVPAKRFQSVVYCSPKLEKRASYSLYIGGSLSTSFTISSTVTKTTGN